MRRVVITGATGSIGIALIQRCIKENIEVLVFCRNSSKRIDRIPQHALVHVIRCDLSDLKDFVPSEKQEYDVFFHFAWEDTIGEGRNNMRKQLKNIEYTLDAVALAERMGCHTFIGAGSQAECGRFYGELSDLTPAFPVNGYGMAKLCAGQMSRAECRKRGLRHIWARILSVYGPYDGEKSIIISLIRKLLAREIPKLTPGEQEWDYLYSTDAAMALLLLAEKGVDGEIYCLGSGHTQPLGTYFKQIRDAIDPSLKLGLGEIPYPDEQVMYLCADISKITRDTGFMPQTDFATGIRKTIEWVKKFPAV